MNTGSAALCSVATFKSGGTPSKKEPEFWAGSIPWVSPKDMGPKELNDATDHISEDAVAHSAAKLVPEGTVLVVTRSGILARTVPVGIARTSLAFNQDIKAIQPDRERLLPEFLYWALKGQEDRVLSSGVKKGATVHSIQSGFLENLEVPTPPLDEQRRIVDILNHAESIRRLKEQARAKAKEIIPALFIDMFGDPASNPKGWPVKPLSKLVSVIGGATPSKKENDYWGGSIPWVSPKDMKQRAIRKSGLTISEKALAETAVKLVPAGSTLVVVRGMILARYVPIAQAGVSVTLNQDMKALVPTELLTKAYLTWVLSTLQTSLMKLVSTAAHGTKRIDTPRLLELAIPVPPIDLQTEFGARWSEWSGEDPSNVDGDATGEALVSSLSDQIFGK